MIPRYCKPCGENLLPEQVECPFCGQPSVPIDDAMICPGCSTELLTDWCESCQSHTHEWSTKTLDEWKAENPHIVADVRKGLRNSFCEFFGATEEQAERWFPKNGFETEPLTELRRTGTGGWL